MVKKQKKLSDDAIKEIVEVIYKQLLDPDIPEVKNTYDRVINSGFPIEAAKKLICAAFIIELNDMIKNNQKLVMKNTRNYY